MKKWMPILLCAWAIALLIPSGLRAQAGATGAITGTVLDEKGGAISGATIVIINKATGQEERRVTSTSAGTFNVPSLPPGHYRLEVAATGFKKFITENVLVQVTETATVTANATCWRSDRIRGCPRCGHYRGADVRDDWRETISAETAARYLFRPEMS